MKIDHIPILDNFTPIPKKSKECTHCTARSKEELQRLDHLWQIGPLFLGRGGGEREGLIGKDVLNKRKVILSNTLVFIKDLMKEKGISIIIENISFRYGA